MLKCHTKCSIGSIWTPTAHNVDTPINVNKCCCIHIGPRAELPCAKILLCNEPIPWVNEMKILGLHICNKKNFSCNRSHLKSKFYQWVNSILSRIPSSVDTSALLTLLLQKVCHNCCMALKRQDYLQTNLKAYVMHTMKSLLKYLTS